MLRGADLWARRSPTAGCWSGVVASGGDSRPWCAPLRGLNPPISLLQVQSTSWSSSQLGPRTLPLAARTRSDSSWSTLTTTTLDEVSASCSSPFAGTRTGSLEPDGSPPRRWSVRCRRLWRRGRLAGAIRTSSGSPHDRSRRSRRRFGGSTRSRPEVRHRRNKRTNSGTGGLC